MSEARSVNGGTASRSTIGIDVGGTHTDVVVVDGDGAIQWVDKVSSDPGAPLRAIRVALQRIPANQPISLCVNGTTIGLDALQRRLPSVALVATSGFGDLLYMRRETKANIYDLDWRKPEPLIPRDLTFEAEERIGFRGQVVRPLANLEPLREWLDERDIDDVAVSLLHSYRNPVHERALRLAIKEARPDARVTLSSEVWPEWREFERTYNTALNACLKPIVMDYVSGLVAAVKEIAGHEEIYLMHADGGVLQPDEIIERPVLTLLSGTVAGALLGARVAKVGGVQTAVSLDMGGTSSDIALSQNGQPRRSSELAIEWEGTLGFAGVDVVSIGAGGGSIAWADEAGGLHVGPMSAGADPGPASYNRGGMLPALTDAYLLLGYLGLEPRIGGRQLSVERAQAAFEGLADRTGLEGAKLYLGVYEIANSNLAQGIRRATINRGVDPRTCTLMCFGGAGPVHAGLLVRHLGLASALIPPRPGNGSAFGLLLAPIKHSVSQTYYAALDDLPTPAFERVIRELRERATAAVATSGDDITFEWYFSLRYRGQTRELTIPVNEETVMLEGDGGSRIARVFHTKHEDEFTFSAETEPVQLVTIRCEAAVPESAPISSFLPIDDGMSKTTPSTTRAYFGETGEAPIAHKTVIIPREALDPGDRIRGPAVLPDIGSTVVLPPGSTGRVDEHNNMIITWSDA